jgi:hypothetical protein
LPTPHCGLRGQDVQAVLLPRRQASASRRLDLTTTCGSKRRRALSPLVFHGLSTENTRMPAPETPHFSARSDDWCQQVFRSRIRMPHSGLGTFHMKTGALTVAVQSDPPRKKPDVLMAIFFVFMGGVVFVPAVVLSLRGHDALGWVLIVGGLVTVWAVLRWRCPPTGKN